jgi:hypothetical protein
VRLALEQELVQAASELEGLSAALPKHLTVNGAGNFYDPLSIEAVLRAMGLAPEAPELAPARAPPGCGQAWFGA